MHEPFHRTPRRTPALKTHTRTHARMRTTQPTVVVVRSPSVSSTAGLDDDVNVNESADVVSELRNDADADVRRGNVTHARGDSACSTDGYVIERSIDRTRFGIAERRGGVHACDGCDLELIIALGVQTECERDD